MQTKLVTFNKEDMRVNLSRLAKQMAILGLKPFNIDMPTFFMNFAIVKQGRGFLNFRSLILLIFLCLYAHGELECACASDENFPHKTTSLLKRCTGDEELLERRKKQMNASLQSHDYWHMNLEPLHALMEKVTLSIQVSLCDYYSLTAREIILSVQSMIQDMKENPKEDESDITSWGLANFFYSFYLANKKSKRLFVDSPIDNRDTLGVVLSHYIKKKEKSACCNLLSSLQSFCMNVMSEDQGCVHQHYRDVLAISDAIKGTMPPNERWEIAQALLQAPCKERLMELLKDYQEIEAIDDLRSFASLILSTLQVSYLEMCHGSSDAMAARKIFIIKKAKTGVLHIDVETYYQILRHLLDESLCSDSPTSQDISAFHNLMLSLKFFLLDCRMPAERAGRLVFCSGNDPQNSQECVVAHDRKRSALDVSGMCVQKARKE